jgi:hypothetical protein
VRVVSPNLTSDVFPNAGTPKTRRCCSCRLPLGARVSRVSESADGAAEVFDLAQGQPAAIAWDPQTKSAYVATAGTFGAGSYILKID